MEEISQMKKLLAILLAGALVFSLVACNNDDDDEPEAEITTTTEATTAAPPVVTDQFVEGKFDLNPAGDADVDKNNKLWAWVSNGTDGIENGVNPATFHNAGYLVIEFAGEVDKAAEMGLAWNGNANWTWHEDSDFTVDDILEDDNTLAISLSEYLVNSADFKASDEAVKLYFRYSPGLDTLEIISVYLRK